MLCITTYITNPFTKKVNEDHAVIPVQQVHEVLQDLLDHEALQDLLDLLDPAVDP
jgi:hypothetical protein